MPIRAFPDPSKASPDGLLALGGDLHPDSLVLAYRSGIFPWPIDGLPLPWFCPPERAILELSSLHVPRSLRRARRLSTLRHTIDAAFDRVIRACAEIPRVDAETGRATGTWITPAIIDAYGRMHRLGYAHSAESWDGDRLVGGVYGVSVSGTFSAESMFRLADNASKLALLHLCAHLSSRGLDWIDIQVPSPHLERLGSTTLPRARFLSLLAATQARALQLFDPIPVPPR